MRACVGVRLSERMCKDVLQTGMAKESPLRRGHLTGRMNDRVMEAWDDLEEKHYIKGSS